MTVEQLKDSDKIIFEMLAGSHCYGTATETSDIDIRGVFLNKNRDVFSLFPAPVQVSDDKNDTTYYELRRYIELALDNNPNILELLFCPQDCVKIVTPAWQTFVDNRHLFISKKAKHTFCGYAYAQIKRAKGQNKWINNPKPERKPILEDFCWWVSKYDMPWVPVPLAETNLDLAICKVAGFEHLSYTYRLFDARNDIDKGVFSGGKPLPKSISRDNEKERFLGLLIVNHDAYEQELRDWTNYWEWRKNRNDARWITQESGEMDFDSKNMAHCIRLLLSGINILKKGEPLVRLKGSNLELIRDIRVGKYPYDVIMKMAKELESNLDSLYLTTTIQNEPARKAVDDLYLKAIGL